MSKLENIYENEVFQCLSSTFLIHSLFTNDERREAMEHYRVHFTKLSKEEILSFNSDEQQKFMMQFYNWFLQIDATADRLLAVVEQVVPSKVRNDNLH